MARRLVSAVIAAVMVACGLWAIAAPASAAGTTTVHLRVHGCNGCVFTPYAALLGPSDQVVTSWKGTPVTVRHGKASFQIPTAYTHGMSLAIEAPWFKQTGPGPGFGAVPYVRLSMGHPRPSDPKYLDDEQCWAGTSKSSETLRIRVVRKKGNSGAATVGTNSWASWVAPLGYLTSLPMPEYVPAHQDWPWCPS